MKVIFSRKGSDSSSGKMASPILPCGCLCSIPIPYETGGVPYSDIRFGNQTLQEICTDLKGEWTKEPAHVDPDLRFESISRAYPQSEWRAAFGQSGAAASHLQNQKVHEGDLFLFFGWFKRTENTDGKLKFCAADRGGRHVIYGWLEVGRIIEVGSDDSWKLPEAMQFLKDHPHIRFRGKQSRPNRVYVASERGLGAGIFRTESDGLVLTKPGCARSKWRLPAPAFSSLSKTRELSYHGKAEWHVTTEGIELRAVSKGQEFVFDGTQHPAAYQYWVDLITGESQKSIECAHGS
jgi:hypothetical protein